MMQLFQVYEELGQMLSPALGELARGCYFEFSPSSYFNFVNVHLCTHQFFISIFIILFQGEEDERTEILLAATFLLIVILAFIG